MTGGLLDFFTLEASEYVDQLDALVSRATASAPEPEPFARAIRALRGSATMAKVPGIASLAEAFERLARRVKDGGIPWDHGTRALCVAIIDDTKILIRNVRHWGAADDSRVAMRVSEVDRRAPRRQSVEVPRTGSAFLASAAADAAAALLEFAENPGPASQLSRAMDKVRALRGVAVLNDHPPLGEVVDAVDAAAKPLELGREEATAERRRLFRTAARVLLEGGDAVRQGLTPPTDSPAVREFSLASSALAAADEGDVIVPIDTLLAEGADAVQAAPAPPTTSAQRFRLEVVSQAEHLRRLVHEGGVATDTATRERLSRELRGAVRSLARAAQSFGATAVANLFHAAERGAAAVEPRALDVLDRAAQLLSGPEAAPESLARSFADLTDGLTTPVATARVATPAPVATPSAVATPAPAPTPRVPTPAPVAGPSGAALQSLLATGIAGLEVLGNQRLAEPVPGDEDDVVPIEDLLFRGRDALQRAIAIGDALRQSGAAPDADTLAELYDLLQLAAAE